MRIFDAASHDLSVALEDQACDLLEAAVVEVLHDLDDRLLALADRDQVELVDKGLGLAGRVWAADHGQGLASNLRGQRERLVLHRDHAVDADHGGLQPFDLRQDLAPLQERVVDVSHGVAGLTQGRAQIHEPK